METQFRYSVRLLQAHVLGDGLAVCGPIYIPGYTDGYSF